MDKDIRKPKVREYILRNIKPDDAKNHHDLLRKIFRLEMEYRENDEELDYFENLYQCALLLYLIGDLNDVEIMWEAKHINMDTGCGFDIEFLVGAGAKKTIDYLKNKGAHKIADRLNFCKESGGFDELDKWYKFIEGYYYA